jgi:hypothetical protein
VVLGAGAEWTESVFQASFAANVLAALVAARPGAASAAAFGASAAWLFVVHPRALPALVVAAAFLVLLAASRRLRPAAPHRAPRAEVTVDLTLRAATLGGAPLPSGRFEVALRGVQSATGTLAASPAPPVRVRVTG